MVQQFRQNVPRREPESSAVSELFPDTPQVDPVEEARQRAELAERDRLGVATGRSLDEVFAEIDGLVSQDSAEFVIRFVQTSGQ